MPELVEVKWASRLCAAYLLSMTLSSCLNCPWWCSFCYSFFRYRVLFPLGFAAMFSWLSTILRIAGSWLAEYDTPFRRFVRVLGVLESSLFRCASTSCFLASLKDIATREDDVVDLGDLVLYFLLPLLRVASFLPLLFLLPLRSPSAKISPSLAYSSFVSFNERLNLCPSRSWIEIALSIFTSLR